MLSGDQTKIPRSTVTVAILAGGRSTRFGSDKALAIVPGTRKSLLGIALETARGVAEEVMVIGPYRPGFEFPGLRFVPDLYPDQGPGGGLMTALANARTRLLLVLSCDQPLIRESDLAGLLDAAASGAVAAFRSQSGGVDPLPCALLTTSSRETLEDAFRNGERSMHGLLSACGVATVDPPDGAAGAGRLLDVDAPNDIDLIAGRVHDSGSR